MRRGYGVRVGSAATRVRALGPICVETDGVARAVGTGRTGRALAVLAADPNVVVSSDRLIDALWGWEPPKSARNGLQVQIHRLRTLLGGGSPAIETVADGYRLVADAETLDSLAFTAGLRAARQRRHSDPEAAVDVVREALSLWRGEPFGGLDDELGLEAEAVRLRQERLDAEELASALELELGTPDLPTLHRRVEQHPERERRWADLVTALARTGRRQEALATHRRAVRFLADELGVEPGSILVEAVDGALRSEPARRPVRRVPQGDPTAELFGRRRELEQLADWVVRHRWVTVTGLGGMGKTRITAAAVARAASAFADGVETVSVRPSSQLRELAGDVATRLDPTSPRVGAGFEMLSNVIRDRHLLLVLDGAEHHAEELGKAIELLVDACPRLHVVATSRRRLGGNGEHLWPLDPLDEPGESAALFELAARRVRPDLVLGAEARPVVDRICALVGRIPLFIELAAARLGAQTLESIADRLAVVSAASEPSWGRDVIGWSIERLDDRALTAALALAAFEGGWTRSAAARVATAMGGEEDGIADVVQWGLARFDPRTGRGEMLDPVRDALAASHPERFADARREHASDHLALAANELDRLLSVDRRGSLELLDAERDNFVAATAWAVKRRDPRAVPSGAALALHAWRRGRPDDGSATFADLEERFGPLARHHPLAALTAAHLAMWSGRPSVALQRLEAAEALIDPDDAATVARLWHVRGNVLGWGFGRAADSLRWLRAAHEAQAALGIPAAASTAVMEGYLAVRCGDLERVDEVEDLLGRTGDVRALFWPIGLDVVRGARAAYCGDHHLAEVHLGSACEALDRAGLGVLKSPTFVPLVWSAALADRPALALERAETAYAANRDVSGGWRIGEACVAYGIAELCADDRDAAVSWFERALLAARRAPEADTVAWAASGLVECGAWRSETRRREAAVAAAALRAELRLAVPVGAERLLPVALSVDAHPSAPMSTDHVVRTVREVIHVPSREPRTRDR